MKIFLALLLLSLFPLAQTKAILKIDTGGHAGLIRDILVSKDGSEIISASDDKTIRIWDKKTGMEKRKILGQIGDNSGKIFAIALSNDNRYLAVGGDFPYYENYSRFAGIRIYNYTTGKLIKVLKSHSNIITDLAFSSDDCYLVSASSDKSVKIWETKMWRLAETISYHIKEVSAVSILKNEENNYDIYSLAGSTIAKHSFTNKKSHYKSHYIYTYGLEYLATNGKEIAACGGDLEIIILNRNLKAIKSIQNKESPAVLAYSPNGESLAVGTSEPQNIYLYETKHHKKTVSFKKYENTISAINFIGDQAIVSGGGHNHEIYIWDKKSTKVKKKIVGIGEIVWSVGISGYEIAWGNIKPNNTELKTHTGQLQNIINLKTFKVSRAKGKFKRISTTNGKLTLMHKSGGYYGYNDAILEVKQKDKTKTIINKDSGNGLGNRCYGWYKDFIISGGSGGSLTIYNLKGKEIASLLGHTGEIWSIALDGDRLVSGSSDQTIKIWDLSQLKTDSGKQKINETFVSLIMEEYSISRESVIEQAKKMNDGRIYEDIQTIRPQLTLFISKDNEYIAYTPEGFFDASKNGAKYIGYHINQGADKEAEFISVDKLYDAFYRPDLIQKALKGESLASYAANINIAKLLGGGLAPKVSILTTPQESKSREITLQLKVCEKGGGYDNLTLLLNDIAVDAIGKDRSITRAGKQEADCFSFEKKLTLSNGKNTIGFKATNKTGTIESNLDEIVVTYHTTETVKPQLHLLTLAIDKYRDGDLWLKYSNADAKGLTETLIANAKPLFESIHTYTLSDKEVTKEKILSKFAEIGAKTRREDVFVLYVAGHGITDKETGTYFYLPVDFRYKDDESVRIDGFSQNDFKLALSKIQAMKTLTMLDTCNSGSFAESMASRGMLQKTAISKLFRATGRATIAASSKDQAAVEGYKGHGVFTYALIEALKGKGYKGDDKITILELSAYVQEVVPDITYKKWGYEQVPQSTIGGRDFPIGVRE